VKLVEYFHNRTVGESRRLFSGGEVALLIFVILGGTAVTTAANVGANFDRMFEIGDLDLWDITGNNYSFEEHHEADVPPGSAIEIVNMFGTVDVRPSDTDRLIVDVRKTVRASNREEAERMSAAFTFVITGTGSTVRIASSQDPADSGRRRMAGRQRFKSSLTVRVPRASPVRVDNRNGRVSIQDLAAGQTVTNRYGQVEVRAVQGDIEVNNSFGEVDVRDVTGSRNVKGRFGAITVDLQDIPRKDITVSMEFGDIRLRLPSASSFGVEARTAFGEVRSEFGTLGDEDSSNRERLTRGRVGEGGPQINAETRFGGIRFQKRG
jgi:hypothetical protein